MLTREWQGYTQKDREQIAEITRRVCYREKLTDDQIEFLNEHCFRATRTKIERDGQDLSWEGFLAFSEFVGFLMWLND